MNSTFEKTISSLMYLEGLHHLKCKNCMRYVYSENYRKYGCLIHGCRDRIIPHTVINRPYVNILKRYTNKDHVADRIIDLYIIKNSEFKIHVVDSSFDFYEDTPFMINGMCYFYIHTYSPLRPVTKLLKRGYNKIL